MTEMTGADHAILGTLMAFAVGVVKIIERLVDRFADKKKKEGNGHTNGHSSTLDPQVSQAIKEIHDVVQLRDGDGVPLVYWPRSQMETQKEMAKSLVDINRGQDKMVDRLERVGDSLEEIANNTRNK